MKITMHAVSNSLQPLSPTSSKSHR